MLAGIGRRPSSPDCAANGLTCAVGGRPPWTAWIFDTYVETQLVPRLRPGDIVILDIVASHKTAKAEGDPQAARSLVPPPAPYSPDLDPIVMAFAKLKAHLRRIGARAIETLCKAIGDIWDLYCELECWNFPKVTGCPRLNGSPL